MPDRTEFPHMNDQEFAASSSRAEAYERSEKASQALRDARKAGAPSYELARLDAISDAAYADWRRWVNAMSEAAQAGCYD